MTKPRTQKTILQRKAELIERRQQLTARLAQLDARESTQARKRDSHVKFIFGAGVMAHARINAAFAKQLYDVLHKATTKDGDVKLMEEWFKHLAEEQKKIGPQVVPSAKQQEG